MMNARTPALPCLPRCSPHQRRLTEGSDLFAFTWATLQHRTTLSTLGRLINRGLSTLARHTYSLATHLFLLLALALPGTSLAQAPQPNDPPNVLVEKATSQALAHVRQDASLREGKASSINQAVDELILPYVNFEKTTRLAVGRSWRDATPDQRERLTQAFRGMLIRTYSGALANITPAAHIEMLPYRYPADATDVVVRTRVSDGSREPIPVDYRLEKQGSSWKIYDLNVLGVWFIENYRNQFKTVIQQDGVEGLIRSLETRNTELPVPTKP